MAEAPGQRLGQMIGDTLELSIKPLLQAFAKDHSLYLDCKGPRPTRPGQLKCKWIDALGNAHELDFVLERGGTPYQIGNPAAFVEVAWRRYTKHSRNKAQEIQGALLPLLSKHSSVKPFAGAVVAGNWTDNALQQLRTSGFAVLHIPYEAIVDVYARFGIDVDITEDSPDEYQQRQVDALERLSSDRRSAIEACIRACVPEAFNRFGRELALSVLRKIDSISVLPLHGSSTEYHSLAEAIAFIQSYVPPAAVQALDRFVIFIRYTNGDRIEAMFGSAADAQKFLESFQ